MINVSANILNMLNSPARRIAGRVELFNCSALLADGGYNRELVATYTGEDALVDFTIDRMGDESKFFGYGTCQKLTVHLLDKNRTININKGQVLEVSFGVEGEFTYPCPLFRVEEVSRNESNNSLTVKAYDFLYKANEHKVSELGLSNYTLRTFTQACASILNLPLKIETTDNVFNMSYPNGANFDGTESIRSALNAIAEATQTIYFVDWDWKLTFRRLSRAKPVFHIDKTKYSALTNKTDRKLTAICHATELSDNITASTGEEGVTQYVRNNPFWDLREDVDALTRKAINTVGGMVLSQFDLKWRGNFALEIGDPITITTKDDKTLVGFLINDTLKYNGGLNATMSWNFIEHNAETANNPVNINDAMKMTYAKIDKASKTIELAVKDMEEFQDGVAETVTSLTLTTDSIASEVSRFENKINGDMTTLTSKVNQTASDITSTVQRIEVLEGISTDSNSQITQNAGTITAVVSRLTTVEGKTSTMESQIEQNADNINLKVDKNGIISAINMSSESIDISADKINLDGYATFTDLATSGATTINGSNITTGTISAERINMSGAIDWADLSSSCRNTIASYAGSDGSDAELPDYIKWTYIDNAEIRSPKITGNDIRVLNTFQTVGMNGSQEVVSGYMGAAKGLDASGNTTFGVALSNEWSGDTYAVGSQYVIITNAGVRLQAGDNRIVLTPNSIHLDTEDGKKIYCNDAELSGIEHGIWSPYLSNETPITGVTTRRGWYMKNGYIITIGFYLKVNVSANNQTVPIAITGCPFTPANVCAGGGVAKNVFTAAGLVFSGWNMNTSGTISPALYDGNHAIGDITSTNTMYYPKAGGTVELSGTIILNT